MRRLVAMHILADGSDDTHILWRCNGGRHFKKVIKFLVKGIISS